MSNLADTNEFLNNFEDMYPKELSLGYEMLECFNHDNESETILARRKKDGKKVVVKCYYRDHPFFDETEPAEMRKLNFDGIPSYEGEFYNDKVRCILREYIEGEDLTKFYNEGFSAEFTRRVGVQLCRILVYLHGLDNPVIHRDIKPQNVILRRDGSVALIDFGISRIYKEDKTSDTMPCGTRSFAPPEQYGYGQTNEQLDIYSLGMLLTWMLTGEIKSIEKPSGRLEKILKKCTAFSPKERYKSAKELEKQLERLSYEYTKKKVFIKGIFCGALLAWLIMSVAIFIRYNLNSKRALLNNTDNTETDFSPAEGKTEADAVFAEGKTEADTEEALLFDNEGGYIFKDLLIEEAVRLTLDKPVGPITEEDLSRVGEIYIIGTECFSTRAEYDDYRDEWVTSGQTRGDITTIEDLNYMPNLYLVCICGEKISDVSPLRNLDKLACVDISYNYITDISALTGKEALVKLILSGNRLEDISAIAACPLLQYLELHDAGKFDGRYIEGLEYFVILDICADTDAYQYLGGKTILLLRLGGMQISDISFINDIEYIEQLDLFGERIYDISPVAERTDITNLEIFGGGVTDLSPVFDMDNLQILVLNRKYKTEMEELLSNYQGDVKFSIEYQ